MGTFVIAYDIGTTGVKTCIFEIDKTIKMLAAASEGYNLYVFEDGGAEQDADEWWQAMCSTTKKVLKESKLDPKDIKGLSFCSQMQGMVLVDKDANAVRRPMSYMDCRAKAEMKRDLSYGLQIAGANIFKLIPSMLRTGVISASVKDPLWKYKWVEAHEPENFEKAYKWLDVKEYLIARCTGEFIMTEDSAFATMMKDKNKPEWSYKTCDQFGVKREHMAKIIKSTDMVGGLTKKAASELGLQEGTPVFGGGGDASLIGLGSGCVEVGETHIYSGTSGWVSTIVDKQSVDIVTMIAAIKGAQPGLYNYFAEMETSGKCMEWVKDHLALDEINIYLKKEDVKESFESEYTSLYEYMTDTIAKIPAGCGGVIFTPWLHGNRCPFEDPLATGMFFNIKLETGKTELIRAVLEGICYHKRWMLECEAKKVKVGDRIRFVGGGAISPVTSQILADITGKTIETIGEPQNVGAVGAAALIGVGLGIIPSLEKVKEFIPVLRTFTPNPDVKPIYDRNFEVFKRLYKSNKKNFHILNTL